MVFYIYSAQIYSAWVTHMVIGIFLYVSNYVFLDPVNCSSLSRKGWERSWYCTITVVNVILKICYFLFNHLSHLFDGVITKFDLQVEDYVTIWIPNLNHLFLTFVRHVTGTGSGLLGGIPRVVVQISSLTLKGPL